MDGFAVDSGARSETSREGQKDPGEPRGAQVAQGMQVKDSSLRYVSAMRVRHRWGSVGLERATPLRSPL